MLYIIKRVFKTLVGLPCIAIGIWLFYEIFIGESILMQVPVGINEQLWHYWGIAQLIFLAYVCLCFVAMGIGLIMDWSLDEA